MEYSVGSLAELISGKKSDKKLKLVKKSVEIEKPAGKKPEVKLEIKEEHPKPKQKSPGKKRKLESSNVVDGDDVDKSSPKKKKINKKHSPNNDTDEKVNTSEENAKKRVKRKEKKDKLSSPEYIEKTIFVGNIPNNCTKTELKKHFRKYGLIDTIRIRGIAPAKAETSKKIAAIKKEFHPDRNTVNAYIRFVNNEDAKKAEAENGALFQGHHLRVHCCDATIQHDESKAIFIGNLNFDAEEEDLWTIFKECGPISHVRIVRDGRTGIGKGFGYVNFKDSDSVQLALEMENVTLKNRELRISLCDTKRAKKKNSKRKSKATHKTKANGDKSGQSEDEGNKNKFEKKSKKGTFEKKTPKNVGGNTQFSGTKFDEKKKKKFSKATLEKKKLAKKLTHKKEQ